MTIARLFLRTIAVSSAVAMLAGCVTPGQGGLRNAPVAGPGEGAPAVSRRQPLASDCDTVIPINARNTADGIAREDAYIARNYPGARTIARRRTECNGRTAEVLTLRDSSGRDFNVTFDISSFFGKTSSGDDLDDLLDG